MDQIGRHLEDLRVLQRELRDEAELLWILSRRTANDLGDSGDDLRSMIEVAREKNRSARLGRDLAQMRLLLIKNA
ncbi:hypothetical protein ACVDG8_029385 [Mesorhizobium sp. ORM8.1]